MPDELARWSWTEPSRWEVTLDDGFVIEVWADGYEKRDDYVVFSALIDAEREPDEHVLILGRTPANPFRFDVALVRFPASAVTKIRST